MAWRSSRANSFVCRNPSSGRGISRKRIAQRTHVPHQMTLSGSLRNTAAILRLQHDSPAKRFLVSRGLVLSGTGPCCYPCHGEIGVPHAGPTTVDINSRSNHRSGGALFSCRASWSLNTCVAPGTRTKK